MMDFTQEFNVRRERFVFAYVYVRGCACREQCGVALYYIMTCVSGTCGAKQSSVMGWLTILKMHTTNILDT